MRKQRLDVISALTGLLVATAPPLSLEAAETVQVQLRDGRTLEGQVDTRTDSDALWLQFRNRSFVLSSSFAWSRVESVQIGGKQLSGKEFRQVARSHINYDVPTFPEQKRSSNWIMLPGRAPSNDAARVTSLWATANLANWDHDAEMDGIEVCIVPRNLHNQLIRTSGHLKVTLVGRNFQPPRNPGAFPAIGRWSVRVDAADFHHGCAIYRLPFRRSTDPQNNRSIRSTGLVQIQLQAYGHGLFRAEAPIRLQSPDPVRRDLRRTRF